MVLIVRNVANAISSAAGRYLRRQIATVSSPMESRLISPSGRERDVPAENVVPVAIASDVVDVPLVEIFTSGGVATHCVLMGTPSVFAFGVPVQVMFRMPL